ncbi:MAG: thioredoxin, partial [Myxococcota bacterium]
LAFDAIVIISPEHARIFREAGWSKEDLRAKLHELTLMPGSELIRGALGIAEGLPESVRDQSIPKFRPDGLHIIHAGGGAGLFSAIIAGWANGEMGSQAVSWEIKA